MATEAVLALGSNVGNRVAHLEQAVRGLAARGVRVTRLSGLYDTSPAHVHEQPRFLNAVALASTELQPHDLLAAAKAQESAQGRPLHSGQRFGPRPLDVDLMLYGSERVLDGDILQVPHPRLRERPFVLKPLEDLLSGSLTRCSTQPDLHSQLHWWRSFVDEWRNAGGSEGDGGLVRVFPCAHGKMLQMSCRSGYPHGSRPLVAGAVNATPDSFSDGGVAFAPERAGDAAEQLAQEGADIIDVGGESTRPGAEPVGEEEELSRVLPAIDAIQQRPLPAHVLLSVDTYRANVASRAIREGAHIINDVSGGSLDKRMHSVAAESSAAYVLGHMRGTPQTMQATKHTSYSDVCQEVGTELGESVSSALTDAGLPTWRAWLDPGLGFAKGFDGNLELMRNLRSVRANVYRGGGDDGAPVMVGPSRKGFLGTLTGVQEPSERDYATSSAVSACVAAGADAVRVHNARGGADAASVAHALWSHR